MGEESEREKVLGESILCPSRYPLLIHCGVLFMKKNDILQKSLSWDFLSLSKITWNIASPPPLPPSIYRCSFLLECPQEALFLFSHLPSIQNSLISLHICVIWNLRIKNNPPSLLVSLTVRTRLPLRKISYSNTMKPFFWKASPNKIQA